MCVKVGTQNIGQFMDCQHSYVDSFGRAQRKSHKSVSSFLFLNAYHHLIM